MIDVQVLFDVECIVQVWIVDQFFLVDGGVGFFEIDMYDDQKGVVDFVCQFFQMLSVVVGGFNIVDGVGVDDYEQVMIFVVYDVINGLMIFGDGFSGGVGEWYFLFECFRSNKWFLVGYVQVFQFFV